MSDVNTRLLGLLIRQYLEDSIHDVEDPDDGDVEIEIGPIDASDLDNLLVTLASGEQFRVSIVRVG
jgi:hypothetical protein